MLDRKGSLRQGRGRCSISPGLDVSVQADRDAFLNEWNAQQCGWSGYCINMVMLMSIISKGEEDLNSESGEIRETFIQHLDCEIDKVATVYRDNIEFIYTELISIRKRWPYLTGLSFGGLYERCKTVSQNLMSAINFLDLQLNGLQVIVKYAGKVFRVLDPDKLIAERLTPGSDSKLVDLAITEDVIMIIEELYSKLRSLRDTESEWVKQGIITQEESRKLHARRNTKLLMDDLKLLTTTSVNKQKWYFNLMAKARIDFENEPLGEGSRLGMFLNHLNTFLYLANYYSAIPNANQYAIAVGLAPSVSGVLLSMTPMAAILSTVLYSRWSNTSFKMTLMTSTMLLIVGNAVYAQAYSLSDPKRLFIGRLLVGFGGNRAANRRYIADFGEKESRAMNSITFVAVSGLGQAFGPGIQAAMDYLPRTYIVAGHVINNLTAPAWIFVIVWIIFAILVFLCFTEPTRVYANDRDPLYQPLLPEEDLDADNKHNRNSLFNFNELIGAGICLVVYCVLKEVQESVQTSAPLVTENLFGWSEGSVSKLLTFIGLLVIPFNFIVGYASLYIRSATLLKMCLISLFIGSLIMIDYDSLSTEGFKFDERQYIAGVITVFLSCQVLEGVNMAVLGDVMPKAYSTGLFNSGFLSTESGTIGRVLGASMITIAGSMVTPDGLNNSVIIPNVLIVFIVLCVVLTTRHLVKMQAEVPNQDKFVSAMGRSCMTIGPGPFSALGINSQVGSKLV